MQKKIKFISKNENETQQLGQALSRVLKAGDIVCLFGDLGTGKTTFVKGLAKALGINEKNVSSPTFVLMNVYPGKIQSNGKKSKAIDVFHFDLYRLEKNTQILALGYEEYFYGGGISVVEWADRLGVLLPEKFIGLYFSHLTEDQREIEISFPDDRLIHLEDN